MSIDKQVREMLGRLVNLNREYIEKEIIGDNCAICGFPFDKKIRKKAIDDTFSQIHSLYMEEFEKILPDMFPFSDVNFEENNYEAGYNACLAKIRAKLKV